MWRKGSVSERGGRVSLPLSQDGRPSLPPQKQGLEAMTKKHGDLRASTRQPHQLRCSCHVGRPDFHGLLVLGPGSQESLEQDVCG